MVADFVIPIVLAYYLHCDAIWAFAHEREHILHPAYTRYKPFDVQMTGKLSCKGRVVRQYPRIFDMRNVDASSVSNISLGNHASITWRPSSVRYVILIIITTPVLNGLLREPLHA